MHSTQMMVGMKSHNVIRTLELLKTLQSSSNNNLTRSSFAQSSGPNLCACRSKRGGWVGGGG